MHKINSLAELQQRVKGKPKAYLLLYKGGTEKSECALSHVTEAIAKVKGIDVCVADVNHTHDIHPQYGINTVPVLVEFDHGSAVNVFKGCNDVQYYSALFDNALYVVELKDDETPQKLVVVYSTPTCSWCNTLKAHLKKHRIRYTDIDVSKNEQAAEEMVRRSGQRGVPQTDIGGEMIVGFDKTRINELLSING